MHGFFSTVKIQDVWAAIRVGASVGLPLWAAYAFDELAYAVYAAFGALTSLYGHAETRQRRVETQVIVAVGLLITVAVAATYSAVQGPVWLLCVMLFGVVVGAGTLGAVMGWVPRGEIFFILVLLVIAGIPIRPDQLPVVVAISAGGAGLAVLLTALEPRNGADPRSVAIRLRERAAAGSAAIEMRRHAVVVTAAALGVTSAWLLSLSLQIGHPFWAPITVAALMPALVSTDAIRRTTQLALGTIVGVCFAALLFSAKPNIAALIIIIASCQAIAELFIVHSYAIALFFISPLAIGMSNLGRNLPWPPLLADRLVEAGVGVAVACVTIMMGRCVTARLTSQSASDRSS